MLANPTHPGEILSEEILPQYRLTILAAAAVLDISRPNLDRVIKGKAALSLDLALKIEKAFGVSADLLVRMQSQYDLAQARKRGEEITARVERQTVPAA